MGGSGRAGGRQAAPSRSYQGRAAPLTPLTLLARLAGAGVSGVGTAHISELLALAQVVQHWKSVHKFPRQVHNISKDHTQVYGVGLQSLTLHPTCSINVPPVSPVPPSPYPHSPPPFQLAPQLVRQYRLLLVVRSSLRSLPVCPRVSNQIPGENPPDTRLKRRKHTFISLIPS